RIALPQPPHVRCRFQAPGSDLLRQRLRRHVPDVRPARVHVGHDRLRNIEADDAEPRPRHLDGEGESHVTQSHDATYSLTALDPAENRARRHAVAITHRINPFASWNQAAVTAEEDGPSTRPPHAGVRPTVASAPRPLGEVLWPEQLSYAFATPPLLEAAPDARL